MVGDKKVRERNVQKKEGKEKEMIKKKRKKKKGCVELQYHATYGVIL